MRALLAADQGARSGRWPALQGFCEPDGILAAINPYEEVRKEIRSMGNYVKTVFVKADITTAIDRDPKGLYKKALLPDNHPDKIPNFTGISDPFESPLVCDLTLNTDKESERQSANKLVKFVLKNT